MFSPVAKWFIVHLAVAVLITGVGLGGHRTPESGSEIREAPRRVVVEDSTDSMPAQFHRSSGEARIVVGLERCHALFGQIFVWRSPVRIVRMGRALTAQGRYDLASQPLSYVALRDVAGVLIS